LSIGKPVDKKKPSKGRLLYSSIVGFRISKYHRQNVGWIECNEIQQSLDLAQPNLQNEKTPSNKPICSFEVSNAVSGLSTSFFLIPDT